MHLDKQEQIERILNIAKNTPLYHQCILTTSNLGVADLYLKQFITVLVEADIGDKDRFEIHIPEKTNPEKEFKKCVNNNHFELGKFLNGIIGNLYLEPKDYE